MIRVKVITETKVVKVTTIAPNQKPITIIAGRAFEVKEIIETTKIITKEIDTIFTDGTVTYKTV